MLEWRVKVGDAVAVDDPLVEISTDKVDAEVPSPVAGHDRRDPGRGRPDGRRSGSVLCRIAAGAGGIERRRPAEGGGRPRRSPRPTRRRATAATRPPSPRASPALTASTWTAITGSGPRGRVTKEDVLAAVEGNGAPPQRRRRRAHPRPRGHARQVHEREPLDPDRHELPHPAGGRARRPPQGAQGGRQEAVVHAPDRLGDRAGRARHAGDGPRLRRAGRQAAARDARQRQPRPRRRRRAQGRHALAGRAGAARRRASSASPTSSPATTSWSWARATTRCSPTPTRARTSRSPTRAASAPSPACRG